ncbi:extracellular solute-binding protein [Alkalibaculum bacchi]|uniref:extracellular solute-binding protein n=1 Tax=Alkalibaculum bacchi TaxID=645887 RepID=UPI0026F1ACBD|nr:extracellular solute-binding protein [Alkalibaculum bacchi]
MSKKKWIKAAAVLVCVMSILVGCSSSGKEVITYNTPQDWVNWGNVLTEFNKETGITAPNDNKNSGQSLTALIAEKDSPLADMVYLGIAFGSKAEEAGVLESYKHPYFDQIDSSLKDEEGLYSTVHYGSIAILANTEALGDLPVPKSWEDLLDPMYKGKIGMLDPTSAAVGYSATIAVNEALGGSLDNFDTTIEYFKELNKNEVVYPMQTSTAKLMKGEIPILIDADFNGYGLKYNQNGPIEVVIPQEGTVKIPYIVGLVKDAPNQENGKELIDYLFSDEGQELFSKGFVRPMNASAMSDEVKDKFLPDSDYERAVDVDWEKMSQVQESFNARWTSEILGQ